MCFKCALFQILLLCRELFLSSMWKIVASFKWVFWEAGFHIYCHQSAPQYLQWQFSLLPSSSLYAPPEPEVLQFNVGLGFRVDLHSKLQFSFYHERPSIFWSCCLARNVFDSLWVLDRKHCTYTIRAWRNQKKNNRKWLVKELVSILCCEHWSSQKVNPS